MPFAALRVPCDARLVGPVAELPALAALASVRHLQRVRARSTRVRVRPASLRFSAAPIRPTPAPPAALPATGAVFERPHATSGSATGQPGRDQRASEAPSSAAAAARARNRALRALTRCRCLSRESEANVASSATGPRTRAAQGSRSAAKTAEVERWVRPVCPVAAPKHRERKRDDRNGPIGNGQIDAVERHCV